MLFEISDKSEKEIPQNQLPKYCKQNTLAIVEIHNKLKQQI